MVLLSFLTFGNDFMSFASMYQVDLLSGISGDFCPSHLFSQEKPSFSPWPLLTLQGCRCQVWLHKMLCKSRSSYISSLVAALVISCLFAKRPVLLVSHKISNVIYHKLVAYLFLFFWGAKKIHPNSCFLFNKWKLLPTLPVY